MAVRHQKHGEQMVVIPSGSLTTPELVEEYRNHLFKLIQDGETNIVLDFRETTAINSLGIGKTLVAYKRLRQAGGSLQVTAMHDNVQHVFEDLMLDKLLVGKTI